jgi:photosystem II stability/assembly factor-like uncharacterized protein
VFEPGLFHDLTELLKWGLVAWIIKHPEVHGVDTDTVFGHLPDLLTLGLTLQLAAIVLPLIAMLSTAAISLIGAFTAGFDLPRYYPFLRVSVEETPAGSWQRHLFPSSPSTKGLRHSSYDDPRVHQLIARWVSAASRANTGLSQDDLVAESEEQPRRIEDRRRSFPLKTVLGFLAVLISAILAANSASQRLQNKRAISICALNATQDGNTVWTAGYGGVIMSTNDGAEWKVHGTHLASKLVSICSSSGGTTWAAGDRGYIVRAVGGYCQRQASGTEEDLRSIFASQDGKHVWVVGNHGAIRRTQDGEHWTEWASPTKEDLSSICATKDGKSVWVVGARGSILHSTDGEHWKVQSAPTYSRIAINGIAIASDDQHLWAVGDRGTVIYSDNGEVWQTVERGDGSFIGTYTNESLWSVFANSNGDSVWAAGTSGMMLHSDDHGKTWKSQTLHTDVSTCTSDWGTEEPCRLTSVYGTSDGKHLWAVGPGERILVSDDGRKWSHW